jgi:hypothetical protein
MPPSTIWTLELAVSISTALTGSLGSLRTPYPPHVATRTHLTDGHSQAGQLGEVPQEGRAAAVQSHS